MRNPQAVREELITLGHQLLSDGLVVRTWGNFSMRLSDTSFVITPSGRRYETMAPEDLTVVTEPEWEGPYKPSSEHPMHATTYQLFDTANVVIHTHQPFASALSLASEDIALDPEDAELLGQPVLPIAPYGLPSTGKLHRNVHQTLQATGARVILLKAHGALIWAEDPHTARQLGNDLEAIAERIYRRTVDGPGPYVHYPAQVSHSQRGAEIVDLDGNPVSDTGAMSDHLRIYQERPDVNAIVTIADKDVTAFLGRTLEPYLDDFAQLVGVKADATTKHNLVLTPHRAYGLGVDLETATNVLLVAVKNARAARFAQANLAKPIAYLERVLMNQIYQRKYSKQAN